MNLQKKLIGIIGIAILLFFLVSVGKLWENCDNREITVIQAPWSGTLTIYTTGGTVWQGFGAVTKYKKSFQYWFDGGDKDGHFPMIPTKFYDGGHAAIPGSVRVDLPLDVPSVIRFHTKFGSQEAIETQLVGQVLIKAISMSGSLMSSKESYAEKKNNLVYYIEDQASSGIYKTTQKDVKTVDQLTGQEKIITAVEIINDTKGQSLRQEKSLILESGIILNNLSLGDFQYDDIVKKQIASQQDQTMRVQTGIANAKRAEQDAITVEQQGKADAAKAKWEQEVLKAKAVTEAQQNKEVATLDAQTAEQEKKANILRGEGEAAYKKLVTQANNNVEIKLEAWLKERQAAWAAFKDFSGNIVPLYQSGNSGGANNNAMNWMELMGMKAAKDLNLDLSKGGK